MKESKKVQILEDAGKVITEEEKKALDILEIDTKIEKKIFCTLFTKKKNKPVITFRVHTLDEEIVKYICILKWYAGKLEAKVFDNIKDFLMDGSSLKKTAKEIGLDFDKKFRLLISEN